MDALLKPFKAFFGWPAAVFYEVRHGQEDLDILYPDRRQATGPEAVTNASIAGNMSAGPGLH